MKKMNKKIYDERILEFIKNMCEVKYTIITYLCMSGGFGLILNYISVAIGRTKDVKMYALVITFYAVIAIINCCFIYFNPEKFEYYMFLKEFFQNVGVGLVLLYNIRVGLYFMVSIFFCFNRLTSYTIAIYVDFFDEDTECKKDINSLPIIRIFIVFIIPVLFLEFSIFAFLKVALLLKIIVSAIIIGMLSMTV